MFYVILVGARGMNQDKTCPRINECKHKVSSKSDEWFDGKYADRRTGLFLYMYPLPTRLAKDNNHFFNIPLVEECLCRISSRNFSVIMPL